jgi:DNA-directed RNA polymerase specialized sigma24 family protein
MPNCRSVSNATWEQARAALVFYFSRRHGLENAEDLAQDTLAAIWSRETYEFASEEDFLRVCYGFASRIALSAYRTTKRHLASELPADLSAPATPSFGLHPIELGVLLDEVLRAGSSQLPAKDWALLQETSMATDAVAGENANPAEANRLRVQLHRARKKLSKITGWKESGGHL